MRRLSIISLVILLMSFCVDVSAQKKGYVIGYYNLENLFDIYDDPSHNDEEFLPQGKNKWTEAKYQKKICSSGGILRKISI